MATLKFTGNDLMITSSWVTGKQINLSESVRVYRTELAACLGPNRHKGWAEVFGMLDEIERWIEAAKSDKGKWKKWAALLHAKFQSAVEGNTGLDDSDSGKRGWSARQEVRMALAWLEPISESELAAIEGSCI